MDFRKTTQVTLVPPAGAPTASPVLVSNPTPRWSPWTNMSLKVTSAAYVTAWQSPAGTTVGAFFEAIWQLNSDDLLLRVSLGSDNLIDGLSFKELEDDYKLEADEGGSLFSLSRYEKKRWIFKPPSFITIPVGKQLSIAFKATGGDKKVERGMSVWGVS